MRERSGQTLVATMIVLVIIAILCAVYFMPSGGVSSRADGMGTTLPGAVMAKSKDTVCQNRLQQIRQAIQMRQTLEEGFPQTLEETRLGSTFYQCPNGNEPYQYDEATGTVRCPHPGHGSL